MSKDQANTTPVARTCGNGNRRLYYIFVGTSQGALNRLNLNYSYNSGVYPELSRRDNGKQHYDNNGYFSFGYDGQNRLTGAYGKTYLYDRGGLWARPFD